MVSQTPIQEFKNMFKKGITEGLEQPGRAGGDKGTMRFVESPNDHWRNGYLLVSHSEFKAMKPILVGRTKADISPNQCPGCVMDAAAGTSTKAGQS
ncbi:hypothetical protein [Pseudomonas sp. MWU12-2323]|uniref:hypothetical protein n=1 Tax=Pseudomonas sp. MWU12-2323 TaxID=2651296 RepID=UPI00128BA469|nr:hypothetical protein [Pseudomonas sp. MWU12-2323]MPQ69380.1 hypothetical protein [Pseudomonas sp. MWU12-2323]